MVVMIMDIKTCTLCSYCAKAIELSRPVASRSALRLPAHAIICGFRQPEARSPKVIMMVCHGVSQVCDQVTGIRLVHSDVMNHLNHSIVLITDALVSYALISSKALLLVP